MRRIAGASGVMTLLTEIDPAANHVLRSLRLQTANQGKSVLLIEVDGRKPGLPREVCYEITPAELIAAIRSHGSEWIREAPDAPLVRDTN